MYDGVTKQGGGDGVSQREERRRSPGKLCKFSPVVRGEGAIKEGGVRPCVCWTGPLISCLDDPLQASPGTGQRWEEMKEGGGGLAAEHSTTRGVEDGGKVQHHRQMCNNSHVAVVSAVGGGWTL